MLLTQLGVLNQYTEKLKILSNKIIILQKCLNNDLWKPSHPWSTDIP